ncbi:MULTISPECIES: SHOCT domain-containing protein [Microbacterium]|uniref:SHOCT domain-containing protein n=1 Tax=Microbacterium TaxID=33882 RepID=UPI00146A4B34|nr:MULTISPECIES: SHOCT domain-containing protein [Microbacterium]
MVGADFMPPVDPEIVNPGLPAAFAGIFAVFFVIALIGLAVSVYIGIRKYAVIKRAGHDPLTVDAALAAKVLDSDVLRPAPAEAAGGRAPAKSLEERLSEIDDLHTRGVISDDERGAARAAILGG